MTERDLAGRPAPAPEAGDVVTVAACQLAPVVGEPELNLDRAVEAATLAADRGARIVVLPELVTSGYVFTGPEEARRLAEPPDGATATRLTELARDRDLVVVAGFAELAAHGALYNSALVADRDGLRTVYRKAHLWDAEKEIFTPGDRPPPVVDTAVGPVGVMICYDLEFPEWLRIAALEGAEIVCAPTNWPAEPRPDGERPVEVVRSQASASVNRVFLAVADRVGPERGVEWVGGSAIIRPDGFPVALADPGAGEQTLVARCTLGDARTKRLSPRNDVLADRRPELYGRVART